MQKYPHPGQQWCLTMCERWTSQSTMRGTRLDGRMVSPFIVRLVQALSWQTEQERQDYTVREGYLWALWTVTDQQTQWPAWESRNLNIISGVKWWNNITVLYVNPDLHPPLTPHRYFIPHFSNTALNLQTNLSVDALGGHTLSADAVAGAVDSRSLHPAAAQRKLLQPLRVSCIASFCRRRRERDLVVYDEGEKQNAFIDCHQPWMCIIYITAERTIATEN